MATDSPKPQLTLPILFVTNGPPMNPIKKKGKRKTYVARSSLQVRKDLQHCSHSVRVTWTHKLQQARAIARSDGHQLDEWSARHRYVKGKNVPQYFVAVCKRCRGVFIVERAKKETFWLFPYGTCRAVPRKVVMVGGQIMVSGEATVKDGFKRKFV